MFTVRNERTASCKYYPDTNTWADFGGADIRGGTNIDLVRALEQVDFQTAVQSIGSRYNVPILSGDRPNTAGKILSNREYERIGIVGYPVYQNMLRPEQAQNFTYQQIQHLRTKYDCGMNDIFKSEPGTYAAILQNVATPFMKGFYNQYLFSLHALQTEKAQGDGLAVRIAQESAREIYSDYSSAYKAYQAAIKHTPIENRLPAANFERDLHGIAFKSIEIGDYPYANLKAAGKLHHIQLPQEVYTAFAKAVRFEEIHVPDFAAHIKGDTVTLSCHKEQENTFQGIFKSIQAMTEYSKAADVQRTQMAEMEME